MIFSIELGAMGATKANWLVYTHFQEEDLDRGLSLMDKDFARHERKKIGPLAKIRNRGGLTGKLGEAEILKNFPHIAARHWLILGLGNRDELNLSRFNEALHIAVEEIALRKSQVVAFFYPYDLQEQLGQEVVLEAFARELTIRFQNPRTESGKTLHPFKQVKMLGPFDTPENQFAIQRGTESAEA